MDNQSDEKSFKFTYSAKEQDEIKKIRQKYILEDDKVEKLRRLDKNVTKKGTMYSVIIGVVGSLLLGVGMSCTMVLNKIWFIPGIIVGVIGIALIIAAYPVYNYITQKEREKIAPEIIRLTDELMK